MKMTKVVNVDNFNRSKVKVKCRRSSNAPTTKRELANPSSKYLINVHFPPTPSGVVHFAVQSLLFNNSHFQLSHMVHWQVKILTMKFSNSSNSVMSTITWKSAEKVLLG